jgi:hypothetical protein
MSISASGDPPRASAVIVNGFGASACHDPAVTHYLLSIYQPDGPTPPPEVLAEVTKKLDALNADLKAAGSWVFAGGLRPPSTAGVVRAGDLLVTDGPFAEGREHLGGFTIITAPDLDTALAWGRRLADAVAPLPVEVRAFDDGT